MIEDWMKNYLVSDINHYNVVIHYTHLYLTKNGKGRQIMLVLNLVLMTLHMRFAISIEPDK